LAEALLRPKEKQMRNPKPTKADRRLAELIELCDPSEYAQFVASIRANEREAMRNKPRKS